MVGRVLGAVVEARRAARRASFLHHLQDPGARRRHPAAADRALPGRDDDRPAEPLLGPEGRRRALRGRAELQPGAVEAGRFPIRAITGFHRSGGQFRAAASRRRTAPTAPEPHEEAENDGPDRRCRSRTGRTSSRWISSGRNSRVAAALAASERRERRASTAEPLRRSGRPSVAGDRRSDEHVTDTRTETDCIGAIEVPADAYWGAQTAA